MFQVGSCKTAKTHLPYDHQPNNRAMKTDFLHLYIISHSAFKMTKVAIVYYSMYGHVLTMAESVKKGIEEGGATCDIYQVPETLSEEVLGKMGAPPKADYPIITPDKLLEYDGIMFGISGRFGSVAAQMKVRSCI